MKGIMRNIAFLAVALMYIVSTMGYGVHRCTTDGTASLILLFGETPCEFVHSHIDSEGNTFTHSHLPGEHTCPDSCSGEHCHPAESDGHSCGEHSSDCCSTNVYVLTEDQNVTNQDNSVALDFQIIQQTPVSADGLLASVPVRLVQPAYNLKIFPYMEEVQASLCTFRI